MLLTFYTLNALAAEWSAKLRGAAVVDAYSQSRAQLCIEFGHRETSAVFFQLGGPLRCLYRRDKHRKARRNVASLFPALQHEVVADVTVADRDRHVFFDFESGRRLHIVPFGPRPNVLLVDGGGVITDAFLARGDWVGRAAPTPVPAPEIADVAPFSARWGAAAPDSAKALMRAVPLFDRTIAAEALFRAMRSGGGDASSTARLLETLHRECRLLELELLRPEPRIYRAADDELQFSLIALSHLQARSEERFDTVDEAVERFVRRWLAERAFRARRNPLESALEAAHVRARSTLSHLGRALESETRADQYERMGHLLMASAHEVPAGASEVHLSDYFGSGAPIGIELEPALSPVQNAEKYYARARRLRSARVHAERRREDTEAYLTRVQAALASLRHVETLRELEAFEARNADLIAQVVGEAGATGAGPAFRQFVVAGQYPVLVGKNARQNDELTFRVASKHDLWFHARGVQGSHVIMRLPGRSTLPPRHAIDQAASIAAYFSKASGSDLVPVIVTRRKFVRKQKGGPAGAVVVEREEVAIVPPCLPPEGQAT